MSSLLVRRMRPTDIAVVASEFGALQWPGKDSALFESYLHEQNRGVRDVLVAEADHCFAGYCCVLWDSAYEPFRVEHIPEIVDLNVLPRWRRRGVGTALLDTAESSIATRSRVAGIGCGLYADYGAAMRLYVARGYLPDGRGIVYDGQPVRPGQPIRVDDSATLMFTKSLHKAGIPRSAS